MNHLVQLFLVCLIAYGCSLIYRSQSLARKTKRNSLDYVAQIQTNQTIPQNQKDIMVLEWVKTLGEANQRNTSFGDLIIASIVVLEFVALIASFNV